MKPNPKLMPKPGWLKKSLPKGGDYQKVRKLISTCHLNTVCEKAGCPNMFECFENQTATFLISGPNCSRNCGFCNISSESPLPLDPNEPVRVAQAVKELGLNYAVITSVTRDDLADGGADHFAETISIIKSRISPSPMIEVLIPDFNGSQKAIETVLNAGPDVLNHNIETVKELYPDVRPQADFDQSLSVIRYSRRYLPGIITKSGVMVGLGESVAQLETTFEKLYQAGCDILTIGQYLQPSTAHLNVEKFYTPDEFEDLKKTAESIGFKSVASGPFVRSSFNAAELFQNIKERLKTI